MLWCPIGMYCWMVPLICCWIVPLYWYWFDSVSHWHLGGLFHTAPLAIYLTALVVSVLTVIVIILLGVSSRVCCLPADKGKGIADRPWAWRARRLYMWAGCAWIGFLLVLFRLELLSLDDKSVELCSFVTDYELVLFLNWGTPLLNFLLMKLMFSVINYSFTHTVSLSN